MLFPFLAEAVSCLTAVLGALAAVQAALAALFAHKTTAENSEAGCEAASVLLLLRRGTLLVLRLLVLHRRRTLLKLEKDRD
jgi:ABC-type nickel/cobalt efflux system permease component RcnA